MEFLGEAAVGVAGEPVGVVEVGRDARDGIGDGALGVGEGEVHRAKVGASNFLAKLAVC